MSQYNIDDVFKPLFIRSEFLEEYKKIVSYGLEESKKLNILYIGLTRNNEKSLLRNINYIQSNKNLFNTSNIFIYENDSVDNTKNILDDLSKNNNNFHYISKDIGSKQFGSVKSVQRIQLLSSYRNDLKNEITNKINENTIPKPDYIIVLDLDFVKFFHEGLIHSIGYMKHIDPLTKACAGFSYEVKQINGSESRVLWNYDCWAFRLNHWDDSQKYNTQEYDNMLWFGFWTPQVGSDPIVVNSAFGGSCIYDADYYLSGAYGYTDCEHVCFHKDLKDKRPDFKLRCNPSQVMLF